MNWKTIQPYAQISDALVVIVGGTSISGDAYSGVPTKEPFRFIEFTERTLGE